MSPSRLDLLHMIMSTRGGECVVELEIEFFDVVNWTKIQSLVSTYPPRLQTLRLIIVGPSSTYLSACLANPFREVRDVCLRIYTDYRSPTGELDDTGMLKAFAECETLQRFGLVDNCNDRLLMTWPPRMALPWERLEHLELCITPLGVPTHIPSRCTKLFSFTASLEERSSGLYTSAAFPSFLTLPRLRKFSINQNRTDIMGIGVLFDLLNVPELKEMYVYVENAWPQTQVLAMIARSGCFIETFGTFRHIEPTHYLIPLLRAMPYLKTLTVRPMHPINDAILGEIMKEGLVPQLQVLYGWNVNFPTMGLLVAFLRSRWGKSISGVYMGLGEVSLGAFKYTAKEKKRFQKVLLDLNQHGRTVDITWR